jgi:hypothetical protein
MENMEDFCVSHNYTQWNILLLLVFIPHSSSSASVVATAALLLFWHRRRRHSSGSNNVAVPTKHVTNKDKAKHIMNISHINVKIYDKTATSQQNSD